MQIAVGGDGAGFQLKQVLRDQLEAAGHEVIDAGTDSDVMVDYPEYAFKVRGPRRFRAGRARHSRVRHGHRDVDRRQ